MERAYSLLETKSIDEDQRIITGIATTPTTDRTGDVVEPKGAEFQLPIPLLWQHDHSQPIGHVTAAKVTAKGIEITAKFAQVEEAGPLKDRLDEAWQSVKAGLVRGLSVGFKAIETSRIDDTFGIRFLKWLWLELSAVTIPANGDCSIQTVKTIDRLDRASAGLPVVSLIPAPAKGPPDAPQSRGAVSLSKKVTP
jgi:HK97 family phage prohead protease